jgi:hypothetical protein
VIYSSRRRQVNKITKIEVLFVSYSNKQRQPLFEHRETDFRPLRDTQVTRNHQHSHVKKHNENQSSIAIPAGISSRGSTCIVHARRHHAAREKPFNISRYLTEIESSDFALSSVFSVCRRLKLSKEVSFVGSTRPEHHTGYKNFSSP